MGSRLVTFLALSAGATILLAQPVRLAAEEKAQPDLTGRWQLNKQESEDARQKMSEARQRGGGLPGAGGMGGPGGGAGDPPAGGGRGPGGGRGGGRPEGGPGGMRALLDAPEALTITGNAAELTLDDGQGLLVRLHADGKAYKAEGGGSDVRARWKDDSLLVERSSERGPKLRTTYARQANGKLFVTSKLEGPMGEVSVRRVYDAVGAR